MVGQRFPNPLMRVRFFHFLLPGISKVRLLPYHGGGSEVRVLGWVMNLISD